MSDVNNNDDNDERAEALVARMREQHESAATPGARIERSVRNGIERVCEQIALQREEFEAKRARKKRVSANESRAMAVDPRQQEDEEAEAQLLNSLRTDSAGNRIELENRGNNDARKSDFASLLEQLDAAREPSVCFQIKSGGDRASGSASASASGSSGSSGSASGETGSDPGGRTGPGGECDGGDDDEEEDGGSVPHARITR